MPPWTEAAYIQWQGLLVIIATVASSLAAATVVTTAGARHTKEQPAAMVALVFNSVVTTRLVCRFRY